MPGKSILVGLVGAGVQASLAPRLHEEEGARQGLHYMYKLIDLDLLDLTPAALPEIVTSAERLGFSGLNITYPCKQAVIELLDRTQPRRTRHRRREHRHIPRWTPIRVQHRLVGFRQQFSTQAIRRCSKLRGPVWRWRGRSGRRTCVTDTRYAPDCPHRYKPRSRRRSGHGPLFAVRRRPGCRGENSVRSNGRG